MDKEDVVSIYNGILAIRNDEYPPFASTWMGLEGIMLSEVNWRRTNIWFHSYREYKKIVKGIIGERRENEWEKSERVTKHERLLTLGNKQGVVEGEVSGETG